MRVSSIAGSRAPVAGLLAAQRAVASAAILARDGMGAGLSAPALAAWRMAVAASAILLARPLLFRYSSSPGPASD
ncbi:MAG TPA: hypothetical protein VGS41_13760, partial [Chthonomonadales bacterium]|nr:hypothetical protein [Chthonomonadales bacterium]